MPVLRSNNKDLLLKQVICQNLISDAIRGHASAQRRLFADHYSYIMSVTLRYMGSRQEAEEALNDTFLKIFDQLNSFDATLPFKPWIRRIAVNTCIDRLRRIRKNPIWLELSATEDTAFGDVDFELDSDVLIAPLLRDLPPRYRAVLNLYVFEGYKHKEISKLLNISEGTSKSNLARAKVLLKKRLLNMTRVDRRGKIQWAFKIFLLLWL